MFSLKAVFENVRNNRKYIIPCMLICCVLFGLWGYANYRSSLRTLAEAESSEEVTEYLERLAEYDEVIKGYEESLALAEEQAAQSKKYCENSIYMQIDPTCVQTGCIRYLVEMEEGSSSDILNLLNTYTNTGGLVSSISSEAGASAEYLQELISSANSGNVVTVTMLHYDEEELERLLDLAEASIDSYYRDTLSKRGKFKLTKQDRYTYQRSNTSVLNTQNTQLGNYKSNTSSAASVSKSLLDQRNSKKTYEETKKPELLLDAEEAVMSSGQVIRYAVLGLIVGALLPFVWFALCQIVGDTVGSEQELIARGLLIYGSYSKGKSALADAESFKQAVGLAAERSAGSGVYIEQVSSGAGSGAAALACAGALEEKGLDVSTGCIGSGSPQDMSELSDASGCIILAELGKTTYAALEAALSGCGRADTPVWGCVVIR